MGYFFTGKNLFRYVWNMEVSALIRDPNLAMFQSFTWLGRC
jgi:hypothetical protein